MASMKRIVLITGCSEGGLGASLAISFHNHGLRVFATARNTSKMTSLSNIGIETLKLDVLSDSSIENCVREVTELTGGTLDILINNAGGYYGGPFSDLEVPKAKELFDLNVWSYINVTQAFLPLLLKSKGMIVNNTSIGSLLPMPFGSVYHASKAAMAMFSEHQRLELAPFGVKVVDMKTGTVRSLIFNNFQEGGKATLRPGSMYTPAKAEIESSMRGEQHTEWADAAPWAEAVVGDLLKKNPPTQIWRGGQSWSGWLVTFVRNTWLDGPLRKATGLDVLEARLKEKAD